MLAIAIIVFRETLEAALIVSIVLAASLGVVGRGRWIAAGVAGGAAGAGLVALFAAGISGMFSGNGQELLNASVLLVAVCMLAWHNIWMAHHARELAATARDLGRAVATGGRPLAALALITGVAVLREGSETVLFVFGVAAASPESSAAMLAGGLLGLAGGAALGVAVYRGLLRIPVRRLFAVTSWMVLLLAAGLASQAVSFLVQADMLPPLGNDVWDTSFLLSDGSIPGRVLHTLIGYVARPQGVQLLVFGLTILAIGIPMWLITHPRQRVLGAAALLGAATLGVPYQAAADLKVRVPQVDYLELELEHNGLVSFGHRGSSFDREQSYTNEIEYGVLPWWKIGIEGELASGGGQHLTCEATTLENIFQLTEPGEYAFNLGFFAEYAQATGRAPNEFTLGPIIQKELPDFLNLDTVHTFNLFFSREVGGNASRATALTAAWQSVARFKSWFAPGFEYYGLIEDLGHAGRYNQQEHLLGPVLTGSHNFAPYGRLKYEVGYLFGLTAASPTGAVRWRLEYEIVF